MFKKALGILMAAAIVIIVSFVPVNASGGGKFSEANYERFNYGFTLMNDSGYTVVGEKTGDVYTYTKVKPTQTRTVPSNKNVVMYKVNTSTEPKYVHSRVQVAAFSDEYRTAMKTIQIRRYKDASGASNEFYVLKGDVSSAYAVYDNDASEIYRYFPGAWTLGTEDTPYFHTLDFIFDVNGSKPGTTYVFIDGRFNGHFYVSNLSSVKQFYGYEFRILKDSKERANCYIEAKFDLDRIGHAEYYDTADYEVAIEDVITEAGLADPITESSDPQLIMSTSDLERYMPGIDSYAFSQGKSQDQTSSNFIANAYNQNVKFNVDLTVATISQNTTEDARAATMLKGFYRNGDGKVGGSWARFSFDQTINKGDYVEYYANDSDANNPMSLIKFLSENDKMVAYIRGSAESDTNNFTSNSYPLNVAYNDKVHVDMVLDLDKQIGYYFVNGTFVGSAGYHKTNLRNMYMHTKGDAEVVIENWSMKLYNSNKQYDEIYAEVCGYPIWWDKSEGNNGVEVDNGYFAVYATPTTTFGRTMDSKDVVLCVGIFDENNTLLDMDCLDYISGVTISDEIIHPVLISSDKRAAYVKLFAWKRTNNELLVEPLALPNVILIPAGE